MRDASYRFCYSSWVIAMYGCQKKHNLFWSIFGFSLLTRLKKGAITSGLQYMKVQPDSTEISGRTVVKDEVDFHLDLVQWGCSVGESNNALAYWRD